MALGAGLLLNGAPGWAAVPLPKPRPADAPKPEAQKPGEPEPSGQDEAKEPPPVPQPSACRLALTDDIAVAPSIPPIKGPGACGGDDLVRLEAVIVAPGQRVALKPAAILRCTMAAAITGWVRNDLAPFAATLGSPLAELDNFDSYECRGRNRVKGALLSEHGKANALDVRGFKLSSGLNVSLTDRNVARATRERVLHSVCGRFSTVLGPSSDWYHEDHIHLDLAERRNNYRICQWDVADPMPEIAPLLPVSRPEEAPPRPEVEEKPQPPKPSGGKDARQ